MTRISYLVLATATIIAACGGSQKQPTTTGPSNTGGGSGSAPPTTSVAWVDDASMCANHPDELGPWNLTQDQMSKRFGTGVTALASITTSQAHPIEVCGVPAENVWLASSTCADGSHPYPGADLETREGSVEASRAGNTGEGGRCGGIIDLYKAKCPEKTYDVYIDMNLCGPGESFM
jgi:hypothetical protein